MHRNVDLDFMTVEQLQQQIVFLRAERQTVAGKLGQLTAEKCKLESELKEKDRVIGEKNAVSVFNECINFSLSKILRPYFISLKGNIFSQTMA